MSYAEECQRYDAARAAYFANPCRETENAWGAASDRCYEARQREGINTACPMPKP